MSRAAVTHLAVLTVALGAAPSSAQVAADQQPSRTATAPYAAGVGIDCERTLGCVTLVPAKGERFVHFTAEDASGTPVYGTVTDQLRSSLQVYGEGLEFCGSGSYLTHGRPVYVYFENHLGSWHGCPGGASRGVVHADFYR